MTAVLTVGESPWIEKCLGLEIPDSPSKYSSGAEKLRAHLALSLDRGASPETSEKLRVLRQTSRARVYDLQSYTKEAHWGPFTDGGDCELESRKCHRYGDHDEPTGFRKRLA